MFCLVGGLRDRRRSRPPIVRMRLRSIAPSFVRRCDSTVSDAWAKNVGKGAADRITEQAPLGREIQVRPARRSEHSCVMQNIAIDPSRSPEQVGVVTDPLTIRVFTAFPVWSWWAGGQLSTVLPSQEIRVVSRDKQLRVRQRTTGRDEVGYEPPMTQATLLSPQGALRRLVFRDFDRIARQHFVLGQGQVVLASQDRNRARKWRSFRPNTDSPCRRQ